MKKLYNNKIKPMLDRLFIFLLKKYLETIAPIVKYLEDSLKQLRKTGVNSELSNYIYRDYDKMFVSGYDKNYENLIFTENIENAFDFGEFPHKDLYLSKFNLGVNEEMRFRFKNMLKLSGGNFGPDKTNIGSMPSILNDSNNKNKEASLSEIDNLNMDQM